jgi:hypothetical protein
MSECDRGDSTIRRPWPGRGYCALKKKKIYPTNYIKEWEKSRILFSRFGG